MYSRIRAVTALSAAAVGLSIVGAASASVVNYDLHNHPDVGEGPPGYGLRLDELYNATGSHDVFTFDFDDQASKVGMRVDEEAGTIRITGVVFGGRDIGSGYANDQYRGLYTIDMLYQIGVEQVAGDDDLQVDTADFANWGTILTPLGDAVPLTDFRGDNGFSLRIGDENNDLGHRGYAGISGWGWINHGEDAGLHVASSDWLFTAVESSVPAPGAAALGLMGFGLMARRRRA